MVIKVEKINRFFAVKRNLYVALGCLLALLLFYLIKSYIFTHVPEESYSIGQDSRWPTVHLMGKERHLSAFNNDLLSLIAKQAHVRFHIVITPDAELISDLEKGKLQGILTAAPNSYLNERFLFSEPYFRLGEVLVIRATAPIEGWNEEGKKIIGIQAKDSHLSSLAQDPSIQIQLYEDVLTALTDLNESRIDGALLHVIPAYTYVTTFYKDDLKIVTLPLTDEGIRLVALKDKQGKALIKHFNQGLEALRENKTYDQILKRWGLINIEDVVKFEDKF